MGSDSPILPNVGMKLILEVIFASLIQGGSVRYSVITEEITGHDKDPDDIVQGMMEMKGCGGPAGGSGHCFVHSTSWRYEPERTIVLTYLVYSDLPLFKEREGKTLPLDRASISRSDSLERPRPHRIDEEHVVAHGIRHLGHLVRQNVQNVCAILSPDSIAVLREMEITLAGRLA